MTASEGDRRKDLESRERIDEIEARVFGRIDEFDKKFTARADQNRQQILSAIRLFYIGILVFGALIVASVGLSYYYNQNRIDDNQSRIADNKALATRTNDALCNFRVDLNLRRNDLQTKVKQTEDFIAHHPEGFAGISIKIIGQSLKTDKKTLVSQTRALNSLSTLSCPETKTKSNPK